MVHYLTVQDVLWINTEITKKVCSFKYLQLEEAVNYQYGYGKSVDVLGQAGQFLQGFLRLRPFETGNRATAFISALTFLKINGFDIDLDPHSAKDWVMAVAERKKTGIEAVKEIARPTGKPLELKPAIRTEVKELLEKYSEAVSEITDD
ncbi:MAG TPA: hypothetical protein VNK96_02835 [Fimbriimonadales bacterium]|nr:hypothetical protein [Fimbriimonadales bacterium]